MNKFFTKIVGASLAIAMMIGVGAGLNAAKQAKEVNADAGESFQLVKDAATLSANDQIVIGSATSGSSVYLLSTTQNSNNRSATGTFTVSNDKVTLTAAVQVLTLGQTNSHWTFNTGSGYLYAASSSKNYLRTQTTNDTNGEWTISITAAGAATITAQGSNTHNKLKYNANNGNPIFSAYDSNGTVAIYKKVASSATVTSVSASIKDGTYYVGNHLSSSDFNVTVSWSEGDDTHPTSGFTWTVNGVANGTLNEGNNSVVLTYQQVNSAAFNVIGSIEHGTLENDPLSAGEAFDKGFALASKGETTTQYYIQGVVSEIIANQLDAENDKYATFWLQNGNEPHGVPRKHSRVQQNILQGTVEVPETEPDAYSPLAGRVYFRLAISIAAAR